MTIPSKGIFWVYPRAYGGTIAVLIAERVVGGLSPRLRGNRAGAGPLPPVDGSIPAPAGEPCQVNDYKHSRKVYPRACGGTVPARAGRK